MAIYTPEQDALIVAGSMLANCAYNLAQIGVLTDAEKRSLNESREAWDKALPAYAATLRQQAARVDDSALKRFKAAFAEHSTISPEYDGCIRAGLEAALSAQPSDVAHLRAALSNIIAECERGLLAPAETRKLIADTARIALSAEPADWDRARPGVSVAELQAAQGEAVAWLHTVTQGDGETDQALSFSPDSFPLDTQLGFRSLGCRPLGYIDTHPAAPVGVPDGWRFRAIPGGSDTVGIDGPNGEEWWIDRDHKMHSLAKALLAAAPSAPEVRHWCDSPAGQQLGDDLSKLNPSAPEGDGGEG